MAKLAYSMSAPANQRHGAIIPQLLPLGMPGNLEPQHWRKALKARIKFHLDAADRLVEALDTMDGDPDFEPNGDEEPSLGWPLGHGTAQLSSDPQYRLDEELEQDNADWEPSLGAPEVTCPPPLCRMAGDPESWLGGHLSGHVGRSHDLGQTNWAAGSDCDGEDADADLEPDTDAEPIDCQIAGGGSDH